jgi:hypothetical protein
MKQKGLLSNTFVPSHRPTEQQCDLWSISDRRYSQPKENHIVLFKKKYIRYSDYRGVKELFTILRPIVFFTCSKPAENLQSLSFGEIGGKTPGFNSAYFGLRIQV